MNKKNIFWGIVGVLALLFIGYLAGNYFRKVKEWNILEKEFNQKIEKIDDLQDILDDTAEELEERIAETTKVREEYKKDIDKREKKLSYWRKRAASKVEPLTLEECKDYTVELEGTNSILTKTVLAAESEIFDLRGVIDLKEEYIDYQDDKIGILTDKNSALKRLSKKDKRVKIWSNILSGGAGLAVGFGLGKVN